MIPTEHPSGISSYVGRAVVSYAGTPRWEIPERLAKARGHHARYIRLAQLARSHGAGWLVAVHLRNAAWARTTIKMLLTEQRALDTIWSEQLWYPYPEYEARRAALTGVQKRTPQPTKEREK